MRARECTIPGYAFELPNAEALGKSRVTYPLHSARYAS